MSARNPDLHMGNIDREFMDTDGLDWNEDEEVSDAFFKALCSCKLLREATRVTGWDVICPPVVGTANDLSTIMC